MSRISELKCAYEEMETAVLLEMHSSGTMTQEAYEAIEAVLRERSVAIPTRPCEAKTTQSERPGWQRRALVHASRTAQVFAAAGIAVPILLLSLDYLAVMPVESAGALMFPAMFVLFLFDWRGGIGPELVIAIIANVASFAAIGWLVGYGWPRK